MDKTNIAAIIIASIAALSAWASQKSAGRSTNRSVEDTNRVQMEKEAYERARAFDTETIKRQDEEIRELRDENTALRKEINLLLRRVSRLEQTIPPAPMEELDDQLDADPR